MKISESDFLENWKSAGTSGFFFKPLVLNRIEPYWEIKSFKSSAILELSLQETSQVFRFLVVISLKSSPAFIETAALILKDAVARESAKGLEIFPMIACPYLNPEKLESIEKLGISAVDLSGNGVINVPERLYINRSGKEKICKEEAPPANPFKGKSSLPARMLLKHGNWESLNAFADGIKEAGGDISLPQISKSLKALADELLIKRNGNSISIKEPRSILKGLEKAYKSPGSERRYLKLKDADWAEKLASDPSLNWSVSGLSSASRYCERQADVLLKVSVSDIGKAEKLLEGTPKNIPAFADIEIVKQEDPGAYFLCETDEKSIRWASPLQAAIELLQSMNENDLKDAMKLFEAYCSGENK